jgi:hypothetical protein
VPSPRNRSRLRGVLQTWIKNHRQPTSSSRSLSRTHQTPGNRRARRGAVFPIGASAVNGGCRVTLRPLWSEQAPTDANDVAAHLPSIPTHWLPRQQGVRSYTDSSVRDVDTLTRRHSWRRSAPVRCSVGEASSESRRSPLIRRSVSRRLSRIGGHLGSGAGRRAWALRGGWGRARMAPVATYLHPTPMSSYVPERRHSSSRLPHAGVSPSSEGWERSMLRDTMVRSPSSLARRWLGRGHITEVVDDPSAARASTAERGGGSPVKRIPQKG